MNQEIENLTALPARFKIDRQELDLHARVLSEQLLEIRAKLKEGVVKAEYERMHVSETVLAKASGALSRIQALLPSE